MTDTEKEKILECLQNCKLTINQIAKQTGLSNSTLKNYIEGKTKPNKANLTILKLFFSEKNAICSEKNENSTLTGNVIDSNIHQDNRQYYSDSPDVLRAQIDELERLMADKEERIKEKDAQIKEKDAQIHRLLSIVEASVSIKKEEK